MEQHEGHPARQISTPVRVALPHPSAEAVSAAHDLALEGLVEAGSLAESYSRSLAEAAWRGDRSTVEVHLRQLRICVVAAIDVFKRLAVVEEKGGRA